MNESTDRMQRFSTDIAQMRLKTGRNKLDRGFAIASAVAVVGGFALAIGAYAASLNVTSTPGSNVDVLQAHSCEILAIIGVGIGVVGAVAFLRYSFAQFLRLWLLRQSYEQQALLDEAAQRSAATSTSMP
jgi:hypothetical protein